MHTAIINDIVLHYRTHGRADAPALVLVNSLGTDARIWDGLIALMSDRYRIISYDKRGHGLSDAPAGDYSLDQQVDDLAGLVDHLGITSFVLCGVSVGGLIAQGFALRRPEALAGLVLCDTAPKVGDTAMWDARIAAVRQGGMAAIVDGAMLRWFTETYRRDKAPALAGWRNMLLRTPVDGYVSTCATLREADLRNAIGTIATPTLVLVGDEDLATPVDLARDTAARIPGARFEIIAACGHIPSIEQPETLAALLSRFLHEVGHE